MVWMGKASRDQAVQAAMVALATEMAVASSFCPHRGAVAKKRGGLPFLLRMGQRGAAGKAWTRGFPPLLRIDRLRSLHSRRDQTGRGPHPLGWEAGSVPPPNPSKYNRATPNPAFCIRRKRGRRDEGNGKLYYGPVWQGSGSSKNDSGSSGGAASLMELESFRKRLVK